MLEISNYLSNNFNLKKYLIIILFALCNLHLQQSHGMSITFVNKYDKFHKLRIKKTKIQDYNPILRITKSQPQRYATFSNVRLSAFFPKWLDFLYTIYLDDKVIGLLFLYSPKVHGIFIDKTTPYGTGTAVIRCALRLGIKLNWRGYYAKVMIHNLPSIKAHLKAGFEFRNFVVEKGIKMVDLIIINPQMSTMAPINGQIIHIKTTSYINQKFDELKEKLVKFKST